MSDFIRNHSFSTYATFSEKPISLTPPPLPDTYTYVCVSGGKNC